MNVRLLILLAVAALAGCSSDEVHSPLDFFPGGERASWSECGKFGTPGSGIGVCAAFVTPSSSTVPTAYSISFYLPGSSHVRLAAFDSHATLVKVLLDQVEPGTIGAYRVPAIVWDFTDAQGKRVPKGDYRCYFSSGDFISFSDIEVP